MEVQRGFTLIELMIVVAIIAIIAAIAVPNLLSSKLAANETNAISTLRNMASAQATFQSSVALDNDLDGAGEYGSLGEMSGLVLLNVRGGGVAATLDPPILPTSFRAVDAAGLVTRSGYYFALYLPDPLAAGVLENPLGGPNAAIDDDNCEVYWSCFAWPVTAGSSGNRAFYVDHRGEILQTKMNLMVYSGAVPPPWNAALTLVNGDMSDPLALGAAVAIDGNDWTAVQ